MQKTLKSLPIFVVIVTNLQPLNRQKKIVTSYYEMKIKNNKQIKIQCKSFHAYINSERVEKHNEKVGIQNSTHINKQDRIFNVVLKYMHLSNVDNIRKEIKDHGHIVTNAWNSKKHFEDK